MQQKIRFMIFSEITISTMFPIMIWRCLHGWCERWTLGEWGDDLPPHPSPGDGHGKPVFDSWGGWRWWTVQMGLSIGPDRDADCGGPTETTWSKDDSWRGSLCFGSLSGAQWCCSNLCGQWTRTLQLTVSSEATLSGKDTTHPRKCNQERWMGWATFDPAIRTAVSIILSHHSVHDHMFFSVWPTCSRV